MKPHLESSWVKSRKGAIGARVRRIRLDQRDRPRALGARLRPGRLEEKDFPGGRPCVARTAEPDQCAHAFPCAELPQFPPPFAGRGSLSRTDKGSVLLDHLLHYFPPRLGSSREDHRTMKFLPFTSLLVVLALTRSSAGQTLPWDPTGMLVSSTLTLTASTSVALPAAPGSVTAVALNTQDVLIKWVDRSSNETGFEIQRQTRLAGKVILTTTVGTTGADTTSFVDTCGVGTFSYRVRAVNALGSSAWTKWVTVTVRLP